MPTAPCNPDEPTPLTSTADADRRARACDCEAAQGTCDGSCDADSETIWYIDLKAETDAPAEELAAIDAFCESEGFRRVPDEQNGRVYHYAPDKDRPNFLEVTVQGVRWLKASPRPEGGDSHRLVLRDGTSHYICPGWIAISWRSTPPFMPSGGYAPQANI